MKQLEPLPIEVRRAAWSRVWVRLLADPAMATERPTDESDARDKGDKAP